MSTVSKTTARYHRIPLSEVMEDATHGNHTHIELITATTRTADGYKGTGYSYRGGRGGRAVHAMIANDLAPILKGRNPAHAEQLYDELQMHMHDVARGGIASLAIPAVDIALRDIRCKRASQPLWRMAGGACDRCNAYAGGMDFNYPLRKPLDPVRGHLDRGMNAVKIKVGQPSLPEDIRRVEAVRRPVGARYRVHG